MCEYLSEPQSQSKMLNYIESISQIAYLPNSLRSLKDSEKCVDTWTSQHPVTDTVTQSLIERLSGNVAFGIDLMQLTPDCGILKLHHAAVLLHFMSVVVTTQQIRHFQFFRTCVLQPMDRVVEDFGEVLLSQENWHSYDAVYTKSFGVCRKCWTRAFVPKQSIACPICHTEWRQIQPDKQSEIHDVHRFCCTSKGVEIARDILTFLFHASRLSSLAIGIHADSDELSEVGITDTLQNTWSKLEETLEMTTNETGLLMHYVIDQLVQLKTELQFGNKNDHRRSLETLEHCIADKIWQPSLIFDLQAYLKCISDAPVKYKTAVLEIACDNEEPSTMEQMFQIQRQRMALKSSTTCLEWKINIC